MEHPVPFCGRMSYCYSKCLKMILDWKGDQYPLSFLECLTTVPFGFVYVAVAEEKGGFAVNSFNSHVGVRRALEAWLSLWIPLVRGRRSSPLLPALGSR
jgi:hypothetical protein